MRKDNSTLLQKLKQYSALAAPMIACVGIANGQVIYTDIADKTLDNVNSNPESYKMDLNNDGTVDVKLQHRALGNNHSRRFNEAVPESYQTSGGGINVGAVGAKIYTGLTSILTSTTVAIGYPYVYSSGITICDNVPWLTLSTLLFSYMGASGYIFPPTLNFYQTSTGGTAGYWVDAVDKYLPLRITDASGNQYYGWARCDAPFDGSKLVVKDYAFEATAGVCIAAGDVGVGINTPDNDDVIQIFSFNRILNVNFLNAKMSNASIHVLNVMGQEMVNQKVSAAENKVSLNQLAAGSYVVQVNNDGKVTTRKITVQ